MSDVWEEVTAFELPAGDEALEDEGYSNNIDIDNLPSCSQEMLEEILGNAQEEEDEQFVNMLADTFGYNDIEDNMLEHMIDISCDVSARAEDYTNDTLNFIANPKNEKSCKLHERYQK